MNSKPISSRYLSHITYWLLGIFSVLVIYGGVRDLHSDVKQVNTTVRICQMQLHVRVDYESTLTISSGELSHIINKINADRTVCTDYGINLVSLQLSIADELYRQHPKHLTLNQLMYSL